MSSSSSVPTVSTLDATNFPAPSGTKVATNLCLPGPEGCDPNGPAESSYPVLLYEGYTFWPLSYEDNRVSFAIVITSGSDNHYLTTFEAPGSRYIDSINVFSSNDTVNFVGQAFEAASVSWATLANQASVSGAHQSSAVSTLTTLSTSTLAASSSSSTASSTGSPPPSSSGSSTSTGTIAGAAVGSALGAIVLVVMGIFGYKKLRKEPTPVPPPPPSPPLETLRSPTPDMTQQEQEDWRRKVGQVAQQLQQSKGQDGPLSQTGSQTAVNQREAEDQMTPPVQVKNTRSRPSGARRDYSEGSDAGQSNLPGDLMVPPQSDAGRAADQALFRRG